MMKTAPPATGAKQMKKRQEIVNILDRIEGFLEILFEGSWLRRRAVLARLDRRVIREVDRSRIRIGESVFVGHEITVRLAEEQAARLRGVLKAAAVEIEEAVRAHLRERGYRSAADPSVTIEVTEGLAPGTVVVEVGYGGSEIGMTTVPGSEPKGVSKAAKWSKHFGRAAAGPRTVMATVFDPGPAGGGIGPDAAPRVAEIETPSGLRPIAEGERLRVGRGADCEIVLGNPRVSLEHAELFVRKGRVRVRDLGSANGTLVNGRRVNEAELDDACSLRLGGDELRVHYCIRSDGHSLH